MILEQFERYPLTFGPSPVHRLERLTQHLARGEGPVDDRVAEPVVDGVAQQRRPERSRGCRDGHRYIAYQR